MFKRKVTWEQHERACNNLRNEIYAIEKKYWELREAHILLMTYLKVKEVKKPEEIVIEKL